MKHITHFAISQRRKLLRLSNTTKVPVQEPIHGQHQVMTHELLGKVLQTQRILRAQPLLDILAARVLYRLQVKEVSSDEQRLHVIVRDRDPPVVRVVYKLLQSDRINVIYGDHLLLGLDQIMHEHGVKVGNARCQHDPMRGEFVLLRHERNVAQLAQSAYFLHVLEGVVGPVRVDKVFNVGQDVARCGLAARSWRVSARRGHG